MQLTYNGVVIAKEFTDGGTDAISGFFPKGEPVVQKVQFIRAKNVKKFARGLRDLSMSGTIILAPGPTLEAAMLDREMFYASLPDEGDLQKTTNGTSTLYRDAKLGPFEVLEMDGVGIGFRLTFHVDPPTKILPTDAPITDSDGTPITDKSGPAITD